MPYPMPKFIKKSTLLLSLLVLAALFLPVPGGYIYAAGASERTSGNSVKDGCLTTLKKNAPKAIAACNDVENIKHARNVASYRCKDVSVDDNAKESCITGKALDFIEAAARDNPIPTTPEGFTSRLTRQLNADAKKTGGSIDKADSQDSLTEETLCAPTDTECIQDPAACAANPKLQGCPNPNSKCSVGGCDLIGKYINPTIDIMTAVFGLIAVISLIVGGIQYSASAGDPQKVTAAKKRIFMTITALVAYAFLYGFVQFLIPGGLFNK